MANKTYPGEGFCIIRNSFQDEIPIQDVPASRIFTWNQELPSNARAVYIGGNSNYNLYVEGAGDPDNAIIPFLEIAGGIWHPICPRKIIHVPNWVDPVTGRTTRRYETTAPNIIIACD